MWKRVALASLAVSAAVAMWPGVEVARTNRTTVEGELVAPLELLMHADALTAR